MRRYPSRYYKGNQPSSAIIEGSRPYLGLSNEYRDMAMLPNRVNALKAPDACFNEDATLTGTFM